MTAIWRPESTALELSQAMARARTEGSLVICGEVFAEIAANPYVDERFVADFLEETDIGVDYFLGEEIWRLAAARYRNYVERRRIHQKEFERRLIADYIIGAHALVEADRLMTLDRRRYERDFPELKLI
jgi:predicted nucleic acid-binding protein